MAHTWSYLGDTVSDATHHMYYRGQRIKEAYYRGEKIWGIEKLVGVYVAKLPDKIHYPEEGPIIEIKVGSLPNKTHYVEGEDFDYSGAVINAIYKDGHAEDVTSESSFIPVSELFASGNEDAHEARIRISEPLDYSGVKILALYSSGRTEDVTDYCAFYPNEGSFIDLSAIPLGIIVANLPNKVSYSAGERFDYTGVRILEVYANGHETDVTSKCDFMPSGERVARNASLLCVLVTKLPVKTSYSSGERLDYSGVRVLGAYTNGRILDVTSECAFSPPDGMILSR